LTWIFYSAFRKAKIIPEKKQLVLEEIVMGLDGLVCGILGSSGRRHTPFVGAIFLYILANNLIGLIPLQNSSTAYITTTSAIALAVFFYVQWTGIKSNGLGGYLYHMAGSPRDIFGLLLVPLNFPLHIIGEFAKPVSLMFRLYGNVMAGHILVAVFLGLGMNALSSFHVPVGLPFHVPFLFLEILVGCIQAFVFALLTAVYLAMMLTGEHGEEAHAH